jgi:hypothetical protein
MRKIHKKNRTGQDFVGAIDLAMIQNWWIIA